MFKLIRVEVDVLSVELYMPKASGAHWNKLEGDDPLGELQSTPGTNGAIASSNTLDYPTSSWEAFLKTQTVDECSTPHGALQTLHAGADENAKRAIEKSYCESAGTVLSTNWADISSKNTEIMPPEGMEYKLYES